MTGFHVLHLGIRPGWPDADRCMQAARRGRAADAVKPAKPWMKPLKPGWKPGKSKPASRGGKR